MSLLSITISGSVITVIGGVLALVGSAIVIVGQYINSKEDSNWRSSSTRTDSAILDSLTDKDKGLQEIVRLRNENVQKEASRPLSSKSIEAVINKAKALGGEEKRLGEAQSELLRQAQDEYLKVLIPSLLLISEEFQRQVSQLEKEGLVKSIHSSYRTDFEWLRSSVILGQARTKKDTLIYISYEAPRYDNGKLRNTAQVRMLGTNDISLGPDVLQLRVSDDEIHIFPVKSLDDPSEIKKMSGVIESMISTTLVHQLKQDFSAE